MRFELDDERCEAFLDDSGCQEGSEAPVDDATPCGRIAPGVVESVTGEQC